MRNPQFVFFCFALAIAGCSNTESVKLNLILPNRYEGPVLILFSSEGDSIGVGDTIIISQEGISLGIYRFDRPKEEIKSTFGAYRYFYSTPRGIVPVDLKAGTKSVHVANGITGEGVVVDRDTIMRHAENLISLLYNTKVSHSWKVIPRGSAFDDIVSGNQWKLKYWMTDERELYRPVSLTGSRMLEEINRTATHQQWILIDQLNLISRPLQQPGSGTFGKTNGYSLLVCHEDKRIGCDEYISVVEE